MASDLRTDNTAAFPLQEALDRIHRVYSIGALAGAAFTLLLWVRTGSMSIVGEVSLTSNLAILLLWLGRARFPTKPRAGIVALLPCVHLFTELWSHGPSVGSTVFVVSVLLVNTLFFGLRYGLLLGPPLLGGLLWIATMHQAILSPRGSLNALLVDLILITVALWTIHDTFRIQIDLLRRTARHFHDLFKSVHEAVLLLDLDNTILASNPSAQSLFGMEASELRGLRISALEHRGSGSNTPDLDATTGAAREESRSLLRQLAPRQGSPLWCELVFRPLELDDQPRILASIHDIDELVHSREELLRSNEELEQRVQLRTDALTVANEELQTMLDDLMRTRQRLSEQERIASLSGMVAGVAHELNTPLGNALSCAELLRQDSLRLAKELPDPERAPTLRRIESTAIVLEKSAQQAAQLVRQFRQVAVGLESHRLVLILLRPFLETQAVHFRQRLEAKGLHLQIDCPADLQLETHPSALSQVLVHLMENVLHHAIPSEGDHIFWTVTVEEMRIRLAVRDHGPGMPSEALPHLFEPFFTTMRARGGIGLGAHIAWNLATAILGGRIEARNTSPGLEVALELPRRNP